MLIRPEEIILLLRKSQNYIHVQGDDKKNKIFIHLALVNYVVTLLVLVFFLVFSPWGCYVPSMIL